MALEDLDKIKDEFPNQSPVAPRQLINPDNFTKLFKPDEETCKEFENARQAPLIFATRFLKLVQNRIADKMNLMQTGKAYSDIDQYGQLT